MLENIGIEWARFLDEKPTESEIADEMLSEYALLKQWDWTLSHPPSRSDIDFYLDRLSHCEPGTDGAPQSA